MNGFNRRDFLKASAMGAGSLCVPGWLTRALAEPDAAGTAKKRALVLVLLNGGNDGLNTLPPVADPLYAKARPTLAVPKDQILKLNDEVGLHPSLKALHGLFDQGKVGVVQHVGYPNPDRSHFRSMEIWQTAQTEGVIRDGWLGRCLCGDDGTAPHSVSFGSEIPIALWADGGGVLAMENPQSFDVATDPRHPQDRRHLIQAIRETYGIPREGPAEFARRRGLEMIAQAARVRDIANKPPSGATYPNTGLAQGLRFVAGAIEAEFGASVYMVSLGGFDTHANQRNAHANLLQTLSDALAAFQKDIEARGVADSVLTVTFSEFGRRVAENESQGTDHGAAAPLFVLGTRVRPGVQGGRPDLETLDSGDLRWKVDFRSVYASVLGDWLGVNPDAALGAAFERVPLLKA
jgi:uncharacterized protein (DUF1501 family)